MEKSEIVYKSCKWLLKARNEPIKYYFIAGNVNLVQVVGLRQW